jgi:hypothetical protein
MCFSCRGINVQGANLALSSREKAKTAKKSMPLEAVGAMLTRHLKLVFNARHEKRVFRFSKRHSHEDNFF